MLRLMPEKPRLALCVETSVGDSPILLVAWNYFFDRG
jgi:hypothetical protein